MAEVTEMVGVPAAGSKWVRNGDDRTVTVRGVQVYWEHEGASYTWEASDFLYDFKPKEDTPEAGQVWQDLLYQDGTRRAIFKVYEVDDEEVFGVYTSVNGIKATRQYYIEEFMDLFALTKA